MNWFSNLITFSFFMCKHQVHLILMFKYRSVYSQKNFFTFLCGCYCFFMNDKLHDAEVSERSVRAIYACYPMFNFSLLGTYDKKQLFTFLHDSRTFPTAVYDFMGV